MPRIPPCALCRRITEVVNGTKKLSLRNIDNYTRYYGVRLFGWIVWNKKNKKNL
jgi:hypothetical protein